MSKEWAYGLDVSGFVHLPGVLTPPEVEACNRVIDAVGCNDGGLDSRDSQGGSFRILMDHPVLKDCLEALCGNGYVSDEQPAMVGPGPEAPAGVPLSAGDPERNYRLRYVKHHSGHVWGLVSGSHAPGRGGERTRAGQPQSKNRTPA